MEKVTDNGQPPTDGSPTSPPPSHDPKPAGDSPGTTGEHSPAKSPEESTYKPPESNMTEKPENPETHTEPPQPTTTLLNGKKQPNFRIPPPPAQLYHGLSKSHEIISGGKAIYVYRVAITLDLRRRTNSRVDPIQILKQVFGKIKAADPAAMLVPVKDQGEETNYINEPVYIPREKEAILDYLSHSFTGNKWLGHFALRSHYSLWTLKEQPGMRDFLNTAKIWLSATRFHTERCQEAGYIQGTHTAITRRDDLHKVIAAQLPPDTPFGLIPGKRTITQGSDKVAYTALIVECPQENYERVYEAMNVLFTAKHPELTNLQFIPIRPTPNISQEFLFNMALAQNKIHNDMKRTTVRGIGSTLRKITLKDDTQPPISLRQHFLEAKDERGNRIFLGLDAASNGRAFATYHVSMQPQAKNYITNLHQKLSIFDKTSLQKVQIRDETDSHFIPMSAAQGPTSRAITAYELLLLQNNPQVDNINEERIMSPPLNTKRPRQRYAVPPEQHDGANDGLSYKNIVTRRLPPDPAIFPPPQGQPATNPVAPPATNPAPKPANLPIPDSPLMKKMNQQLRAVKEAQELQENKVKAQEKAIADNWGVLITANETITRIQKTQEEQTAQYDALILNISTQAKSLETFQTEMASFRTKTSTDIQDLKNMLQNLPNIIMTNQNIPQPHQPHMAQNHNNNMGHQQHQQTPQNNTYTNNMIPQHQGYNPSSPPMPTTVYTVPNYNGHNQHIQHNTSHMQAPQTHQIHQTENSYMSGGPGHDMKRGRSQSSSPISNHNSFQEQPGTQSPTMNSDSLSQTPTHSAGNSLSETN